MFIVCPKPLRAYFQPINGMANSYLDIANL